MKIGKKVEVIIFRENQDNEIEFLLLLTNNKRKFWQPVTGNVEDFDKNLSEAALRELKEELDISPLWISEPIFEFEYPSSESKFKKYGIELFKETVYLAKVPPQTPITLSSEHQDFLWKNYNQAKDYLLYEKNKEALFKAYTILSS